jgi:hypothetical protein
MVIAYILLPGEREIEAVVIGRSATDGSLTPIPPQDTPTDGEDVEASI